MVWKLWEGLATTSRNGFWSSSLPMGKDYPQINQLFKIFVDSLSVAGSK